MAEDYRIGFDTPRGHGSVDVTVPDGAEPLEYLAQEIARELGLLRFEVQLDTSYGGRIRLIDDAGPGTAFTLTRLDESKDS